MADTIESNTARAFLTARWENVILISYAVDPEKLHSYLPPECVLDLRDGQAFVSLVAFDFLDTRVLGVAWPMHRNFPEINVRFYVRCGGHRGVCFIREFVPRRAIATIARLLYNEPYSAAAITSSTHHTAQSISVTHQLRRGGSTHQISAVGAKPASQPLSVGA